MESAGLLVNVESVDQRAAAARLVRHVGGAAARLAAAESHGMVATACSQASSKSG